MMKSAKAFSFLPLFAIIDGMGIYGNFLSYGLVISFVGGAFLIFLNLWKNKRLDIDEEPKFQMMQEEELKQGEAECRIKNVIK
ncbi:MAG: hypothetical protein ACH350_05345 [Parachlamydiaceae bacterium]